MRIMSMVNLNEGQDERKGHHKKFLRVIVSLIKK